MGTHSDRAAAIARLLRRNSGLSQHALADKAGIERYVLVNLEVRRKANMSVDELHALAGALGVSVRCLLGDPTPADRKWLGDRTWEAVKELAAGS